MRCLELFMACVGRKLVIQKFPLRGSPGVGGVGLRPRYLLEGAGTWSIKCGPVPVEWPGTARTVCTHASLCDRAILAEDSRAISGPGRWKGSGVPQKCSPRRLRLP